MWKKDSGIQPHRSAFRTRGMQSWGGMPIPAPSTPQDCWENPWGKIDEMLFVIFQAIHIGGIGWGSSFQRLFFTGQIMSLTCSEGSGVSSHWANISKAPPCRGSYDLTTLTLSSAVTVLPILTGTQPAKLDPHQHLWTFPPSDWNAAPSDTLTS